MFAKMPLDEVVRCLVETALPRFSPADRFLWVPIQMRYDDNKGKEAFVEYHLLFHRPHNFTKVFLHEGDFSPSFRNQKTNWILQSDHDSCWSSDGLRCIDTFYTDMYGILGVEWRNRENNMNESIHLGMTNPHLMTGIMERNHKVKEHREPQAYIIKDLKYYEPKGELKQCGVL